MAELVYAKKRLEPFIKKYSIDVENDKVFAVIVSTLFPNQTDYQIWALKLYNEQMVELATLAEINAWAIKNPTKISTLSKHNIVSYKTNEDVKNLLQEMKSIDMVHFVENFINQFNTAQRCLLRIEVLDDLVPYEAHNSNTFLKFHKLAKSFSELPTHRKQKFISLMSAVESFREIMEHMANALEESYEWNREDMLSYAKHHCPDIEICYDKDNIVVLRIPSFESATKLCGAGRTSWCLTRKRDYFERYTKENSNGQQYFIFNFNVPERNDLAHVGFTVVPNSGISHSHATRNGNLMSGVTIGDKTWNIYDVLESFQIPSNVYIRLKNLKNYQWDKIDFLNKLDEKCAISEDIVSLPDGRLIIPVKKNRVFQFIFNHTLIDYYDKGFTTYAVIDFSKDVNDENSLLAVTFRKDIYGSETFNKAFNAYGKEITDPNWLAERNLNVALLKTDGLSLELLLHKLIDEQNTAVAIDLLRNNNDLNPNFVFYASMPITKAIMYLNKSLVDAIIQHPRFDVNRTECFGDPHTHYLLLTLACKQSYISSDEINPWLYTCISILDNPQYDVNCTNINEDTTLHCACENSLFLPVVEYLVRRNDVDVNMRNDMGLTPLDIALDCNNTDAVALLLTRQDLEISPETSALARSKRISLKQLQAQQRSV